MRVPHSKIALFAILEWAVKILKLKQLPVLSSQKFASQRRTQRDALNRSPE
jgi:hypothetical protein